MTKRQAVREVDTDRSGRLLFGKKDLLQYFEEKGMPIGVHALDTLIRAGLPGAKIGGRLYFHTYNVDQFLLHATRQRVSPDEENGG